MFCMRANSSDERDRALQKATLVGSSNIMRTFLQDQQRMQPKNANVTKLLKDCAEMTSSKVGSTVDSAIHPSSRDQSPLSLLQQLGINFNALCAWNGSDTQTRMPHYSHSNLLTIVRLCGSKRVLQSLIDLITFHLSQDQHVEDTTATDTAAAMICAQSLSSGRLGSDSLNLRQALQLQRDQATKLMKKDPQRAENIVHLYRLVEAQLAPQAAHMTMPAALDQVQIVPDILGSGMDTLEHDANAMQFDNNGAGFDGSMDVQFDGSAVFNHQSGSMSDLQPSMNFDQQQNLVDNSAMPPQHESLSFAGQGATQDVDMFNADMVAPDAVFSLDPAANGALFQPQAQEQQQSAQDPLHSQLTQPAQSDEPMTDDDFWASLGVL